MQDPKNRHLGTIAQLCRGYIFATKAHIDNQKKNFTKQQYLPTSPQYGELRPTSGCDWFVSLGHPYEFQWVSRLGSVTAQYSSSGQQPNFAVFNRGRHLYTAGQPSRSALAHILVCTDTLWNTRIVTNINDKRANSQSKPENFHETL